MGSVPRMRVAARVCLVLLAASLVACKGGPSGAAAADSAPPRPEATTAAKTKTAPKGAPARMPGPDLPVVLTKLKAALKHCRARWDEGSNFICGDYRVEGVDTSALVFTAAGEAFALADLRSASSRRSLIAVARAALASQLAGLDNAARSQVMAFVDGELRKAGATIQGAYTALHRLSAALAGVRPSSGGDPRGMGAMFEDQVAETITRDRPVYKRVDGKDVRVPEDELPGALAALQELMANGCCSGQSAPRPEGSGQSAPRPEGSLEGSVRDTVAAVFNSAPVRVVLDGVMRTRRDIMFKGRRHQLYERLSKAEGMRGHVVDGDGRTVMEVARTGRVEAIDHIFVRGPGIAPVAAEPVPDLNQPEWETDNLRSIPDHFRAVPNGRSIPNSHQASDHMPLNVLLQIGVEKYSFRTFNILANRCTNLAYFQHAAKDYMGEKYTPTGVEKPLAVLTAGQRAQLKRAVEAVPSSPIGPLTSGPNLAEKERVIAGLSEEQIAAIERTPYRVLLMYVLKDEAFPQLRRWANDPAKPPLPARFKTVAAHIRMNFGLRWPKLLRDMVRAARFGVGGRTVEMKPDVLTLQECDQHRFWVRKLEAEGYDCRWGGRALKRSTGSDVDGNMICVNPERLEIRRATNVIYKDNKYERAGLVVDVVTRDQAAPVEFLAKGTHLAYDATTEEGIQHQVNEITELIEADDREDTPTVIMGDLNSEPGSRVIATVEGAGYVNVYPAVMGGFMEATSAYPTSVVSMGAHERMSPFFNWQRKQ